MVSRATSSQPRAAPARASASTAQLASLSTTTGTPRRSAMTSAKAMSCSGRFTAWTAMPVRVSKVHGIPKPTAATSPPTAVRTPSTAWATISTSSIWSRPSAGRLVRWCTARSASTAPASSLVPPRSTPITHPSATPATLPPMADDHDRPYTPSRARPRFLKGRDDGRLDGDRGAPDYEVHGRRRRLLGSLPGRRSGGAGPRRRITPGRVAKWVALAVGAWLLVSLVLFLVSAQIQEAKVSSAAEKRLSGAGYTLTNANTVLVLGSDARPKGTKEAGANVIGQASRSDSILLMRVGGGANATLSIPRDTVVDIPGHGRNKINAAYAFGGPSLAIQTVENYLGVDVNHLVEVNFENFPELIDSLGGITYTGNCVISKINGGSRNGGTTLRLKAGTHELNGDQALALARTRHNDCRPQEDDRARVRRQQKILSSIKGKVTSFETFVRLPWVSWAAPKAIRSDMSGPTLLGRMGAEPAGGGGKKQVLTPSGSVTLPDGGAGLTVDEATKQRTVSEFMKG